MAPTADGRGYWLVGSDGGVYGFGDAGFYGSTGGTTLNKPIVSMAPTADGSMAPSLGHSKIAQAKLRTHNHLTNLNMASPDR